MKKPIIFLLIISLYGCNGQTKKDDFKIDSNNIVLDINNTSIRINDIITTGNSNNVSEDYIIQKKNNKVYIEPAFLESDLLDGKIIQFLNIDVSEIKLTFYYDAVFKGDDKSCSMLGFKSDTIINLKFIKGEIKIPSFNEIKNRLLKRFENENVYETAYNFNVDYFKNIINSPQYKNSVDYEQAVNFFKKKKIDLKRIKDLFIEIDYFKFKIEFKSENNQYCEIVFNRDFKPYVAKKTTFSIPENYYPLDSVEVLIKSKKFKIIVLEKISEKHNLSNSHFQLPIIILEKQGDYYLKKSSNDKILFEYDNNCPAEGYAGVVHKNDMFTIQQSFCSDFQFVNSYATFKINNDDNIFLYEYGEEYTDRSKPNKIIPTRIWSEKDFGNIKFEDATQDFLIKLRQNE